MYTCADADGHAFLHDGGDGTRGESYDRQQAGESGKAGRRQRLYHR